MVLAYVLVLGICLGSFVNALVWRLHEQDLLANKKKPSQADRQRLKDLSISKGRSMCPSCKHELSAMDLIPVLSWVGLRGKCRYCRTPISWQYPFVEIMTATAFILSYIMWPFELASGIAIAGFAVWLISMVLMVALGVYDFKWYLLPDKLVAPLTSLAVLYMILSVIGSATPLRALLLALGGGLLLFAIFYGLQFVSKGAWIGGGDVKIAFALGLFAGSPILTMLLLFIASVMGTLVALPAVIARGSKLNSQIPFGPYLLAATVIVVLYGAGIIDWYMSILLVN